MQPRGRAAPATQIFGFFYLICCAGALFSFHAGLVLLVLSFVSSAFSCYHSCYRSATTPATAPATAPLIVFPTGSSLDRLFTGFFFGVLPCYFVVFLSRFFLFKSPFLFLVLYLFIIFYES